MNFNSNTLGEIARALKLSSPTTQQESTLTIPPQIILEVEPRTNLDAAFGTSSGAANVQSNSWSGALYGQTLNSGPTPFLGALCAPGIWRIDWTAHFTCDFQNLAGVTSWGWLGAVSGKYLVLVTFGAGLASNQVMVSGSSLLLFDENMQTDLIVAPSGAGQHTNCAVSWIAHRLIL